MFFMQMRRWSWLFLTLFTLFIFLGKSGLYEPDEGRYAEIGREMAASGEWLIPHLNGFEHFQKPPVLYWATALSIDHLGVNEWAARLPSALAALGVVLMTFSMARKLWDESVAIRAVLVLISMAEFFLMARLLTPDMMLTFWTTAALAAFVHRRRWLFFIAMGLGFLTKGPMALVVPISAVLGWQFAHRKSADQMRIPWARGLLLTFCIGLSWFVVLSFRSSALFEYFWQDELVKRLGSRSHGRSQPFWFFIPVLLAGLFPWTLFLWKISCDIWQRGRPWKLPAKGLFLLSWIIIPLAILSCSGSKLPTYILPILPAFALGFGKMLKSTRVVAAMSVIMIAMMVTIAGNPDRLEPWLGQQASVRDLATLAKQQPDAANARFFTCNVRSHGFEFYLERLTYTTAGDADLVLNVKRRKRNRLFDTPEDLATILELGPPAYGIVRQERFQETFDQDRWRALGKSGDFLLIGRVR